MTSMRARLEMASLRAQHSKRFYADPATMRAKLSYHQHPRKTRPPRWARRGLRFHAELVDGIRCYVFAPRCGHSSHRILHLHGGGFVEQPEVHHWRFVKWLVTHTGATVVFPLYPLCPTAEHRRIRGSVHAVYDRFLADPAPDEGPYYVFGDSAGGALTLDLVATLRADGERLPTGLGLLSPWLDLAVGDPRSREIDPTDPELGAAGLRQAGRWYAGPEPLDTPGISPVHVDLTGFPPMTVFTGTRDILNPDAQRVSENAERDGVAVTLHDYAGMFHNWTMQKIPEGARARAALAQFLATTSPMTSPTTSPVSRR